MQMIELVQKFLNWFPLITEDESDLIEDVLSWDNETKVAFKLAKKIFEEDTNE